MKYLFVGNPGTGKTTWLSGLAGRPLFQSGLSYGEGKRTVLQKEKVGKDWYIDTPGLSDMKVREEAAAAIKDALDEGGAYKIVFFVTLEAGRVRPADKTLMELVLGSAPISQYGVIINKLGKKEKKKFLENKDGAFDWLAARLMEGLPTKSLHFCFLGRDEDLYDLDDAVPDPLDPEFVRFIQNMPAVEIKPEQVKQIDPIELDTRLKQFETIIDELVHGERGLRKLEEKIEQDKHEFQKILWKQQKMLEELMARNS